MLEELIKEYYKLFPNARFFCEWFDIPTEDKIEMLKEAIKDKKDITQTKLFEEHTEKVIYEEE